MDSRARSAREKPRLALRAWFTLSLCLLPLFAGACKKSQWIEGRWLHVDENGKPGLCYEFAGQRKLNAYRDPRCQGEVEPSMSGKWQLKDDLRLAVLREADGRVLPVPVVERGGDRFATRGGMPGTFHRVSKDAATSLLESLHQAGVVKVHALAEADGCAQLGRPIADIGALNKEAAPRMLRARDQGLAYHTDGAAGAQVEKVVYALNQEQLDWVALHLKPSAFDGAGPAAWLTEQLGKPVSTLETGAGETAQTIAMWRAYCANLRGAFNKDVDVTLFATAGKRDGVFYVSEGVIAGLWEDLKDAVDSAPPPDESTAEGGEAAGTAGEPVAPKARSAPERRSSPAKAAPKSAAPADEDI